MALLAGVAGILNLNLLFIKLNSFFIYECISSKKWLFSDFQNLVGPFRQDIGFSNPDMDF